MSHVEIRLPFGAARDESVLRAKLVELFKQRRGEFYSVLSDLAKTQDTRGVHLPGSLTLDELEWDPSRGVGSIEVRYSWSAYYGCEDANRSGIARERWDIELDGDEIAFAIHVDDEPDHEI